MRSHAPLPPVSHGRAPARDGCVEGEPSALAHLVLELALTCLEGAALGRALMTLQEAADEAEERASAALAAASEPGAGVAEAQAALEASALFARAERAEFTAATRWANHVTHSRQLARRALDSVVAARLLPPRRDSRARGLGR